MADTFKIHFTNHFFFDPREFGSIDEALKAGKEIGFEFSIQQIGPDGKGTVVAGWQIFRGVTLY